MNVGYNWEDIERNIWSFMPLHHWMAVQDRIDTIVEDIRLVFMGFTQIFLIIILQSLNCCELLLEFVGLTRNKQERRRTRWVMDNATYGVYPWSVFDIVCIDEYFLRRTGLPYFCYILWSQRRLDNWIVWSSVWLIVLRPWILCYDWVGDLRLSFLLKDIYEGFTFLRSVSWVWSDIKFRSVPLGSEHFYPKKTRMCPKPHCIRQKRFFVVYTESQDVRHLGW